jgi:membrane fusion protein (multidrug efflux system)
VSGKITGIFFNEGQRVEKGTLLLKVYDDDLQAQLTKAQANHKLTADVEERQRQLLDREAISRQEYDVSFANLQAAQADVALLKAQISKTEILAPFDGTIGFRKVSPGEYITPGIDIASLVNDDPAKIQFTMPEKYSQLIGRNTVITYRLEGQSNERKATVYAVAPTIDPDTRTLQLKALTPNPKGALIPGAFAKIEVLMQTKRNMILIPAQAILSETAGQKVYIYRGGKAQSIMVETDTRTNDRVEITKGVALGDSVIITGIMQITPRTTVVPANVE